jgi:hypothetical protein
LTLSHRSSQYWAVYKKFASQSQRKYKIIIFFSGEAKDSVNFSFFILLHTRAKPMLPPCVHFSNHKLIITLCSPLVTIFHIQICYQLLQTRPTGEKRYQLLQTTHSSAHRPPIPLPTHPPATNPLTLFAVLPIAVVAGFSSGTAIIAPTERSQALCTIKSNFLNLIHQADITVNGKSIESTQPFINIARHFQLISEMSVNDLTTLGHSIGCSPTLDNPKSARYQPAFNTTAGASGNGYSNNRVFFLWFR